MTNFQEPYRCDSLIECDNSLYPHFFFPKDRHKKAFIKKSETLTRVKSDSIL